MDSITRVAPKTWKEDWHSTLMERVLISQKKNLPVELIYYEEYQRIDEAFYREKQVQGWSRKKKEALIDGETNKLHQLAECKNDTNFKNNPTNSLLVTLRTSIKKI